jgi:hypothetical protein
MGSPLSLYVLAKGVLRYLKGVKSRKIVWCAARVKFPFVPCEIYTYSDASWADVVPQRKSSLSYLIFCNNAVFSWKSSLSSVLAMSSAEAELIALCACAADVAYCRKLANEFGFLQLRPTSFTRIMCVAGFNLSGFNLSVSVSVSEYFRFSIFRFSIRRRYRLR